MKDFISTILAFTMFGVFFMAILNGCMEESERRADLNSCWAKAGENWAECGGNDGRY